MLGLEAILSHPVARENPPTLPLSKLFFIIRHLNLVNKMTATLSFSSVAVLIAARLIKQRVVTRPGGKFIRYIPEILLVVAGTTGRLHRPIIDNVD
jgi:branched-subunit amino acid transport protein